MRKRFVLLLSVVLAFGIGACDDDDDRPIGDGTGGSGVIELVVDLDGFSIDGNGYFLAAENTFTLLGAIPDLITSMNFENSDNVTYLLVQDFIGADGDDLDTDDDCDFDSTPWTTIVDLIASIITDTVEFALRGSHTRCTMDLPDDIWPVVVDEGQISQVIQNLVINGDQAMPQGGMIEVQVDNYPVPVSADLPLKPGNYVRVAVTDQGIGIPQDHIQKIFDPYFTTKQKGSGLGLATTYSIVKRHEGHIAVSSSLGIGTCFTLYLPASATIQSAPEDTVENLVYGTGRILVMDDEEEIRDVLGKMLQHLGFDVDFANDGEQALAFYNQALQKGTPFIAAILDLTIPGGMGGKETLRQIKSHHPDAKVIVSSGYSNDPVMARFSQFGFSGFIAKPYNLLDLSRVLSQIL